MIAAFEWAQPWLLAGAAVAPLVWWFERHRDRQTANDRRAIVGPRAAAAAEPRRRRLLATAALAAVAIAAAGPRWGEPEAVAAAVGSDLIVCLDVSRSMLARDVAPDRLQAARAMTIALARRAQGDRLGLVVFAGAARLAVPLTADAEAYAQMVAAVDDLAVDRGGTDLAAALDAALAALLGGARGGTVLLLTDGDDPVGRGQQAARRCAQQGVTVHCIGFGSARGSKIPVPGEGGGEHFLRDPQGRDVVTAMDRAALTALASAAGGEFALGDAGDATLVDLYARRIAVSVRAGVGDEVRPPERFQLPLAAALLLWLGALAGGGRRR